MKLLAYAGFPANGSVTHRPFGQSLYDRASDCQLSARSRTICQTGEPGDRGSIGWAVLLIFPLSGCPATLPPAPTEVLVPISTPCLTRPQLPAAPGITADSELAKLGDFDFVITLASDRIALRQHAREQAALIEACIR